MGANDRTETIRAKRTTAANLRRVAYGAPFYCSSIADFLVLVERGDLDAIAAWQKEARRK